MHMIIFLLTFSTFVSAQGQQLSACKPTTSTHAKWAKRESKDLRGMDCSHPVILAIDTNLTVMSFTVTGIGPSYQDDSWVAINEGERLTAGAVRIFIESKKGDTILFDCIKAKNKSGLTFILKPLLVKM